MKIFLTVICLALSVHAMDSNKKPPVVDAHNNNVVIDPVTGQLFYTGGSDSPSNTCDRNCEDKMKYCHFPGFANMCKSKLGIIFALKCPKTCGICKPCDYNAGACSANCVDAQPKKCQLFAPTFCKHKVWAHTVQKYCQKSCGICIDCNGLKPVPECDDHCVDKDRQCREWATKKKYCAPDSKYRQWMLSNCKQSCGVCRHCDGEAPPGAGNPYPTKRPLYTTRRPYTTRPHLSNDFMCRKSNRRGGSIAEECLAAHNYFRCLHGVEDLEYDYKLEDSARDYANTYPTRYSQSGVDRDDDVGENYAVLDSVRDGIEEAVAKWYAEGLDFDYHGHDLVKRETSKFSQLIWSETTKVGCGIRRYRSKTYVVAHYYRAGNDNSLAFSNIFEPILDVCSSKCDSGSCQGHDNTHDCKCQTDRESRDRDTVPKCYGNCVVKCPEPRHNRDKWVETCTGTHHCTCITSGFGTLGARCT